MSNWKKLFHNIASASQIAALTIIFSCTSNGLAAHAQCNSLFITNTEFKESHSTTNSIYDSTTSFISYFQESLDNQIIGEKELQGFIQSLEKGALINPIPHEQRPHGPIFIKVSHQIHFEAFERYLSENKIDLKVVTKWAQKINKQNISMKVKRARVKIETKEQHHKLEFHKIEAGQFMMGPVGQKISFTVNNSFELMSTPLTQFMWANLKIAMGENNIKEIAPSTFRQGPYSLELSLNDKYVTLQPDNPVETVSWDQVQRFIQGLNKLSNSIDPETQKFLKTFILGHKPKDVYRLPTEAEWEFAIRMRGQNDDEFPFENKNTEISNYAWYLDNSDNQTQPVSQKLPLIVEGQEFYDLFGNVWELTSGISKKEQVVIRGSGYYNAGAYIGSSYRSKVRKNERSPSFGFRLVREVK